jgi:hypothetical protein
MGSRKPGGGSSAQRQNTASTPFSNCTRVGKPIENDYGVQFLDSFDDAIASVFDCGFQPQSITQCRQRLQAERHPRLADDLDTLIITSVGASEALREYEGGPLARVGHSVA